MSNNEVQVFIRRDDGWVSARSHHKAAFDIFLKDETKSRVQTPHVDGGDFVAHFSKFGQLGAHSLTFSHILSVYKYVDEYEKTVEISYMTPDLAAFINRVSYY